MPELFNGFSQEQRSKLKTAFGKKFSKKEDAVDAFLREVEQTVINDFDPVWQPSTASLKEERAETEKICKHAHGLRMALERMDERKKFSVTAIVSVVITSWKLERIPGAIKPYIKECFVDLRRCPAEWCKNVRV